MWETTSLLSDFASQGLKIVVYFLDYFVAGNTVASQTVTSQGDYLTGAIADIVQNVTEFLAVMSNLLF